MTTLLSTASCGSFVPLLGGWLIASVTLAAPMRSVSADALPAIVITEWMYEGSGPAGGEFFEFTNVSGAPVDLTGWSFDDEHRVAGAFDLSSFGTVKPGQSVILTQESAAAFRAGWGLGPEVVIIGGLGAPSGNTLDRNDEINIYDAQGALVDRLTYGDEAFPRSIRTRWFSGRPTGPSALGANDPLSWSLSSVGDDGNSWVSVHGDVGSPGFVTSTGTQPPPPQFSAPPGLHTSQFELTLTAAPDTTIHFTLDGSTPTVESPMFTGPITIGQPVGQPNYFSLIPSSPPEGWQAPLGNVFKSVVVRAIAIGDGTPASAVSTHTFFVEPGIDGRWTLPVVSIATDESSLFDYKTGIYVPGKVYDENFDPETPWFMRPANYREAGDAWERRASFELFENDGVNGGVPVINSEIGLRVHGDVGRAFRRKPIRLYARGEYGASTIAHQVFPDVPQSDFRRLVLRNGGLDWNQTFFRDAMMQRLVGDLGIDTQAHRSAIVFINGEYWGIHNFRERHDHTYILDNYGWTQTQIDLLTNFDMVVEGSANHWLETYAFALANDLDVAENLAKLEERVDLDDHITHFAAQIYFANSAWPQQHFDAWRPRTPDGRWRWLMGDTDAGFGISGDPQAWEFDSLMRARTLAAGHAQFFQQLLTSTVYRDRFINRYADMMNTAFVPGVVVASIDALQAEIAPNVAEHIDRWHEPQDTSTWNSNVEALRTFATNRPAAARGHVVSHFGLPGLATLTFDNPTPQRGSLRVNTVDLASEPLPWSGVYFDSVAVPVHGDAAPGWRFAGFMESAPTFGTPVLHTPMGDATLTARFVRLADIDGDGEVDGADLGLLLGSWGPCGGCPADLDGDGSVDGADLGLLLNTWGQ